MIASGDKWTSAMQSPVAAVCHALSQHAHHAAIAAFSYLLLCGKASNYAPHTCSDEHMLFDCRAALLQVGWGKRTQVAKMQQR
jgi:hypothetical protein